MQSGDLPSFLQIVSMALRLDPQIFLAVQTAPNGTWIALAVVALAGVSEALGQSLVLFLNHIDMAVGKQSDQKKSKRRNVSSPAAKHGRGSKTG